MDTLADPLADPLAEVHVLPTRDSDCSEKNEREAGVFRFGKLRSLADLLWRGGGRRAQGRGRVCDEAHRRPEYVTYGVEHLGAEKQTRERQKIKKVTLRTCFLVIFFRFFSFSLFLFVSLFCGLQVVSAKLNILYCIESAQGRT